MSSIVVAGDTSGSITLQAPAVSGTTTLTLPTTTGNIVTDTATQTLTNKTLTSPVIAGTPTGVGVLTSDTAKTATGTNVDFTGIPSWVKRITVMLNNVSTNGTSNFQIQIGAGSVTTSGYLSTASSGTSSATVSSGFIICNNLNASTNQSGIAVLATLGSNVWVQGSTCGINASATPQTIANGNISLGGTLDRIRITTVNGTDTFDAGSINILYE
jgi:hypothetical protein